MPNTLSIRAKYFAMSTRRFPSKNQMFMDFFHVLQYLLSITFWLRAHYDATFRLKTSVITLCPLWLVNHGRFSVEKWGVDFLQLQRLKKWVNWLAPVEAPVKTVARAQRNKWEKKKEKVGTFLKLAHVFLHIYIFLHGLILVSGLQISKYYINSLA